MNEINELNKICNKMKVDYNNLKIKYDKLLI